MNAVLSCCRAVVKNESSEGRHLVPRFINTVTFVASATASSLRSDDDEMSMRIAEEERQRNRCRPAATPWAEGVAGDLCVPCRRRCPCIASSSLLDLASQVPSANVIVFMKRGTKPVALTEGD